MKKIALLAALCVGAWYYFVGGRTVDETMVRAYYDEGSHALYQRDAEPACKQLSTKVIIQDETVMNGQTQRTTLNHDQQCEAVKTSFALFEQMGAQMGGILTVEYEFHIDSIDIEPGRKSAKVQGTSLLKMGETVMQFESTFNQRLVREMGQIKLLRSDQRTMVRMAGGRGMSQSDFFSK
ncbi:hypothetical protein [Acidovorax radicis]|uniref:hypothetical protein n=1 Tax=Acidovorax radicis TaxID=758826 RepID=UPI001CFAE28B|nr:hypothetical protein [Acidovorax radicis]UCV00457.1 hypothetical protein KI609_06735 [Acidovorax radicis]